MKRSHKIITGLAVATSITALALVHVPSSCISVNGLPDSKCTPGVINSSITQANIGENICNSNWSTKSERPPSSYTTQLKIKQIKEYGFADTATASYEEDHLVSLELGGNPTDPKNLWPEPYAGDYGAKKKDSVENYLHKQVCNGSMTLQEAQKEISTNWEQINMGGGNLGASNSDD